MANIHNQTLPAGTRLGVYEIKETVKIDIFDITYKGWNHHLKEWVEILEYFPYDLATRARDSLDVEVKSSDDKEKFDYGFKAFLEQAETLTQIKHPNIVETENVLQFNDTAYLVSSYCEGLTLAKVAQAPASIADAELSYILESILKALQKVHAHNIVHGGIYPDTIILAKNGEPLLTGFAGARVALATHMVKLPDQLMAGYVAPELYRPSHIIRPASDFYGLGATLYYCIFHKQPSAYQDRLMAFSKGETDPVSFSESPASQYNPALLKAIEWMLRPGFNDRPQSASEILAQLKTTPAVAQNGSAAAKDDQKASASNPSFTKNPLYLGVAAGILSTIVLGFWLAKKTPEADSNSANIVSNQPLAKTDHNPQILPAQAKDDTSASLSAKADSSKIATPEIKINAPEKEINPAVEVSPQASRTVDKPLPNNKAAEDIALSSSYMPAKQEIKVNVSAKKESGRSHKIATINPSSNQLKKPKLPAKPSHSDSIEGYLAAANKAMKELRLTLPPRDNADHYYQLVLAKDPNNRIALAGRKKIVDRYAWVIRQSKADGDLEKAKRVFKKAESVLPNHPKLQRIRAELQHQNK